MELLKIGQDDAMEPLKWFAVIGAAVLSIMAMQGLVVGSKLIPPVIVSMVSVRRYAGLKLLKNYI